jgi:hypothetical protein
MPKFFLNATFMWNSFSNKQELNYSKLYQMFSEVVHYLFLAAKVINYGFRTFQGSHTKNPNWIKAVFTSEGILYDFFFDQKS